MAAMKPKRYAGDSELGGDSGNIFKESKSNSELLREAKKKGPAAVESYYNKLASARKVDAGKRAKEVSDEYNLRRSAPIGTNTASMDWRLAKQSNVLSRKALGTGSNPQGEFLVGPLKTDEQRNLGRAKNAQMKLAATKAAKGKKK